MQNRFSTIFSAIVITAGLFVNSASAQLLYTEGKDYRVLDNPLPLKKAGQEEVVEFFSYACPHCANLEPHIVKWAEEKKPQDVGFYQIPATGGKLWTFTARVKFVADKLNLGHGFDAKYFDQLHKERNRRLMGSEDAVIEFMVTEGGAEKTAAEKAWNSLQVKNSLKNSDKLWTQAGLTGVPAVIVNGKYLVELSEYNKFFAVIDYLLATTRVPPAPQAKNSATSNIAEKVEQAAEIAKETATKTTEKVTESVQKTIKKATNTIKDAVTK